MKNNTVQHNLLHEVFFAGQDEKLLKIKRFDKIKTSWLHANNSTIYITNCRIKLN